MTSSYRTRALLTVLFFFLFVRAAGAVGVTVVWDASPEPTIGGYIVHYGQSGSYTDAVDVGKVLTYRVEGLLEGATYRFAVQAYTTDGLVSALSDPVSIKLTAGTLPAPTLMDAAPDIFWQNDESRQASAWYMGGVRGAENRGWTWLSSARLDGWRIRAIADINADGTRDLIWQHDTTRQVTVWYMGGTDGTACLGWDWLASGSYVGWTLAGVADMNRDGKLDLLWQKDSTYQVVVWYMGGTKGIDLQRWRYLVEGGVEFWRVAAIHDFDADGKVDVAWQNEWTRQITVWYLGGADGVTYRSWKWLNGRTIPGWTMIGVADFDGNGKADLAWQNDETREVTVWYMAGPDGTIVLDYASLTTGPVPGWTAIVK